MYKFGNRLVVGLYVYLDFIFFFLARLFKHWLSLTYWFRELSLTQANKYQNISFQFGLFLSIFQLFYKTIKSRQLQFHTEMKWVWFLSLSFLREKAPVFVVILSNLWVNGGISKAKHFALESLNESFVPSMLCKQMPTENWDKIKEKCNSIEWNPRIKWKFNGNSNEISVSRFFFRGHLSDLSTAHFHISQFHSF